MLAGEGSLVMDALELIRKELKLIEPAPGAGGTE
jgi:hypothetical protein